MSEVNVETPVCARHIIIIQNMEITVPLIATPKVYLNFSVFTGLQATKSSALRPETKIRQGFSVPGGTVKEFSWSINL